MTKVSLTPNKWAYSVRKNKGYGFSVTLYKNGKRLESQACTTAFGYAADAANFARRVFLLVEYDINVSN